MSLRTFVDVAIWNENNANLRSAVPTPYLSDIWIRDLPNKKQGSQPRKYEVWWRWKKIS